MVGLLVLAALLILGSISFAIGASIYVLRNRSSRQRPLLTVVPDLDEVDGAGEVPAVEADLDLVQIWLDNEWKQRFG